MRYALVSIFLTMSMIHGLSSERERLDSLQSLLVDTHKIDEKVEIYFELSSIYQSIDIDSSILLINRALSLASEINHNQYIAKAYEWLGLFNVKIDSVDQALIYYGSSTQYYKKSADLKKLTDVIVILGNLYFVKGNYPEALNKYNESLNYSLQINYKEKLPHCYNNLGVVYYSRSDFIQALEYFTKAFHLFEEINDTLDMALSMGNVGSVYLKLKDYDLAKSYYLRAIDLYDFLGDDDGLALSLMQIAEIFLNKNKPDSALAYLNRSDELYIDLKRNIRGPKSSRLTELSKKFGTAYIQKGEWGRAIKKLKECNLMAHKINLYGEIMESSKLLSYVYDSLNNTDSSYKYFKMYSYYSDSIVNEENIRKIAQLEYQYKYEQKLIQDEIIENENKAREKRKNLIYLIIVGLLVFTIVIFILLLKLEKSKKTKIDLERIRLKDELDYKNKELTTHMLYLLRKNEFILKISEKLKKLIPSIKVQNKKSISEIINELNAGSSNDSWKEFEIRFQEVHTSFFDNLHKEHPDLSPNEIRLCAFLKLNMTTKDIAAITYQSINSIEMARFRLRKKLNIDKDENLVSFISRL